RYAEDLASRYHKFNDACRVLPRAGEEFGELGRARLWLAAATRVVLASALNLLGVTAPDRM
ncbi:MAG TPA: DALR anticodon-binding domain-containing protein, partial [Streptosporangiaceae bacterium]